MGTRGGEECGNFPKNMFHFLLALQPPARTPPPARSLPTYQHLLALPAQALVCTQWACSGCAVHACGHAVGACEHALHMHTGQRGCRQNLGSSNAGTRLLLHPSVAQQGRGVPALGAGGGSPCLTPKALSPPSAVPVPAGGAGHSCAWGCPPAGAAAPTPSCTGRLSTPQCLLPGREVGHPLPRPQHGADVMRARSRARGLLLGPILFKARGTLHRLVGRTADEKQTAACPAHRASAGSREPGGGFAG